MKTIIQIIGGFVTSIALSAVCLADEVVTKTTRTTYAGTVSEFTPSKTIIVRSEAGAEPGNYAVTKETVYVDEAGAPVTVERVTKGSPVTVYYTRDGDRVFASRVVVHSQPTLIKARARALREYYQSLARNAPTQREKAEARALAEYYDAIKDSIRD